MSMDVAVKIGENIVEDGQEYLVVGLYGKDRSGLPNPACTGGCGRAMHKSGDLYICAFCNVAMVPEADVEYPDDYIGDIEFDVEDWPIW